MPFRIGIHLGDVRVEGPKLYGEGINVAARLERLAEPGGICLSDLVYQQVRRRLDLDATDLGETQLKNIAAPVHAYQIGSGLPSATTSAPRAAARATLVPPDKPSLAVLPFLNMNGDPTQDHFSDGLTIDIMAELVRLPGLFLIGEGSMFTYKATGARPSEVGRELGVRHVLEGAVRREQNRVRITAKLVEAASGRHVWAERFDRDLEDIFAVQDEITENIVTALDVALVGGEGALTLRKHLRDPHAVGLLYQGQELMERFNREDMNRARALFEEVIQLAPECPFGYTDLAWTHYFDVERGWSESPEASLARMGELTQRALEFGDISGFPSLMHGHTHLMRREYDEALALSTGALEERPSCQGAYSLKANILNYCGQPQEAIPLAKQSIRLSPVAQTWFPQVLATAHYLSGSFEEAIETAHAALSLAPDNLDARVMLVASLVATERLSAATEAAREIVEIDPAFTLKRFSASQPYRDAATLKRLVDALGRAGVASGGDAEMAPVLDLVTHAAARRRVAPRPRR
jgi:adenylate cyclase